MHKYSIILSNNENIGPGHTLFSRISFKRIREWKLKKPKEQNKTVKNTQKITIYTVYKSDDDSEQWFLTRCWFFTRTFNTEKTSIVIFSFCIGLVAQLNGSALRVLKHHYIIKRICQLLIDNSLNQLLYYTEKNKIVVLGRKLCKL